MRLSLYADGSSHARGNKPGGWAWVLVNEVGPLKCGSGGDALTTNNAMEVMAIKKGLEYVVFWREQKFPDLKVLDVVSDSQYALGVGSNGFTASKNVEIVAEVRILARMLARVGVVINWRWVRGHDGQVWNERCDRMARAAKERVVAEVNSRRREYPGSTALSPRPPGPESPTD